MLNFKIENGMFTGTFDEFLEYFFDKYGDMLVKNFNKQIEQELKNVELPSNVNLEESQKRTWKKICENIKKNREIHNIISLFHPNKFLFN